MAVSADALQVYVGLETLTGAAGPGERARLEHRLISFLPVNATFSAGQYAELAHAEIDGLLAEGRRPIVVGGTGLYLRAALTELSLRPVPAEGVRERWIAELEARGPAALHAILARRAPWAAETIEPTDRQRIVRALELLDSGELEPPTGESELWTADTRRRTLLVGLVMDREQLYARIDARVDAMVADGVQDEVRRARSAGASDTARKALGFEELLSRRRRADEAAYPQLRSPPADLDAQARRSDRHRPHRAQRRGGGGRDLRCAQNTATNGYMSTTATRTPNAHTPISPRNQARPSRQPSAAV